MFGIRPDVQAERQPGDFRTRGRLNDIPYRDHVKIANIEFGVIGLRATVQPTAAKMRGSFTSDGAPALLENRFGKGRTFWFATTPGISYIKDARIVANALAEKWPAPQRRALTRYAAEANAVPLVKLS